MHLLNSDNNYYCIDFDRNFCDNIDTEYQFMPFLFRRGTPSHT